MKVIVGLGNPGRTFYHTRHNIGYRVIGALAKRHDVKVAQRLVSPDEGRPAAGYGDYEGKKETVRLLMPLTMMNESGEAIKSLDVGPSDLLIVCDDVNLPLGTLRLRSQGGPGGHHGLESCLSALSTDKTARLRFGVGISPLPNDLTSFVLSPFFSEECPVVQQAIEMAVDTCDVWVSEGIDVAMNRCNTS